MNTPYGFRIVGSVNGERRLVDHAAAFAAYAALDDRADVAREAYLSAFTFGADFRALLETTGSVRGFAGACWSSLLWFDIDRSDDLDAAQRDAARLALALVERYRLDDDALLLLFSGSKGFHVGLPTALWAPDPSPTFPRAARRLAEALAALARVEVDVSVYDRVRPFRAPNSCHPKTGLFKRRLSLDELTGLALDAMRRLAAAPAPFDLPEAPPPNEQALADWQGASQAANVERDRRHTDGSPPAVNRATFAFIRDGAQEGDRHRLLYSSARNLAEVGCSLQALLGLLTPPARDSGLSPADVARQIECGYRDAKGPADGSPSFPSPAPTPSTKPTPAPSTTPIPDLRDQLAALWDDRGDSWEPPDDRLGVVNTAGLDFPFGANVEGDAANVEGDAA